MKRFLGALGPLRVPLLGGATLLSLPIVAVLPGTASGLLRGLFDLAPLSPDGGTLEFVGRVAVTCFFAWLAYGLAAVAVYQSAAIIHDFGPERLGMPPRAEAGWLGDRVPILPVTALCVPALDVSALVSLDRSDRTLGLGAGAVLGLGAVVFVLAVLVRRRTRRPPPLEPRLRGGAERVLGAVAARGYLPSGGRDPFVHHAWAAFFVLIASALWAFVALWGRSSSLQEWLRVPALCSAMLLVMLAVWIFSALTFFCDAYRLPVLSVLLLVTATLGFRDHTFATRVPAQPGAAILPKDVLAGRGRPSRIVVVAAAGGGIQAAGWTARVLQGLVEIEPAALEPLLASLVAASGVSGGAVGLAPLVAATYEMARDGGHATPAGLVAALRTATNSSLDPVAASFATSDLVPFVRLADRGDALEASWRRAWRSGGIRDDVSLAALAAATRAGTVPALMLNATDMTTGERLVLGTTVPNVLEGRMPEGFVHAARVASSAVRDGELVVDYEPRPLVADLDLATAARLSATFPFVTPAARCAGCARGGAEYVVDGGYVDNYGTESLVEWLEPLLADEPDLQVDVVQIVSFPEGGTAGNARRWPPQSQLAAPLEAVLNVRTPAQGRRGVRDVDGLARRFGRGRVCSYRFVYDGCDDLAAAPPLSWHLTPGQKADLDDAWRGCPDRPGAKRKPAYDLRARTLVEHVLGRGVGDCAEIRPTVSSADPRLRLGSGTDASLSRR